MKPEQQIKTLETLGITRYRIACDTGINQKTLCNWLRGDIPHKSNSNVKILTDYYEKLMQSLK